MKNLWGLGQEKTQGGIHLTDEWSNKWGFNCTNCGNPLMSIGQAKRIPISGSSKLDVLDELGFCPNCGGFVNATDARSATDNYSGPFDDLDTAIESYYFEALNRSRGSKKGHQIRGKVKEDFSMLLNQARNRETNEINIERAIELLRDHKEKLKLRQSLGFYDDI